MAETITIQNADQLDIPLDRDIFMRTLVRELSGTLEDVVGLDEAAGFISVVGQNVGDQMNRDYKAAFQVSELSRQQVSQVLVDLKRRINGKFYVIEETPEKIVLGNTACPFGDKVLNRTSMCMMTSNVFGAIAAQNLGYAKVELQDTIAEGKPGCRVVVYLTPTAEAQDAHGREYWIASRPSLPARWTACSPFSREALSSCPALSPSPMTVQPPSNAVWRARPWAPAAAALCSCACSPPNLPSPAFVLSMKVSTHCTAKLGSASAPKNGCRRSANSCASRWPVSAMA